MFYSMYFEAQNQNRSVGVFRTACLPDSIMYTYTYVYVYIYYAYVPVEVTQGMSR